MRTIDEYDGKATIVQDDIRSDVRVWYRVQEQVIALSNPDDPDNPETIGGILSWHGAFGPQGRSFAKGLAELEVPGKRSAQIVIFGIEVIDITSMGSSWQQTALGDMATFQGDGPAPALAIQPTRVIA